jgi:hypothetical protein
LQIGSGGDVTGYSPVAAGKRLTVRKTLSPWPLTHFKEKCIIDLPEEKIKTGREILWYISGVP